MTWNVSNITRSNNKEIELEKLLDDVLPDIAVLTETELPSTDTTFTVKDYGVLYPEVADDKYRLLVLIKASLIPLANPTVIHKSKLDLWIKLQLPTGPLAVGAVYRQWQTNEKEDLDIVHQHVADVSGNYRRAALLGDLNLDMNRKYDTSYYRLNLLQTHIAHMEDHGFHFVGPYSPTYSSHGRFKDADGSYAQRSSTLDHYYALGLGVDKCSKAYTVPHAATDHKPVVGLYPVVRPRIDVKCVSRRDLKNVNSTSILSAINASRLSEVFLSEDVNHIHDIIVNEIVATLDRLAPFKTSLVKCRASPLHLRPDTLRTMRERDAAAAAGNVTRYRRLRNATVRLLRRDKLDSNQATLERSGYNPQKVWALANAAIGKETNSSLPSSLDGVVGDAALANHVNEFYIDKIEKLRRGISPQELGEQRQVVGELLCPEQEELVLQPPSALQIKKVISSLKNTGAVGVDGIPVSVLKMGADVLADPVAHMVAVSIRTGIVPAGFKMANVTPVHKRKKPTSNASSYRPVSILPALSKVLERVVHRQLMQHLEKHLPNSQHGFRPKRSTVGAIISSHGQWMRARSAGHVIGIAAYDLSSAFDTLDHGRLVKKLDELGIRGVANSWSNNYLHGRSQRVVYNGEYSAFKQIKFGVPQGSILGPLLFLCLLTDLPSVIERSVPGLASSSSRGSGGGNNGSVTVGSSGYADDCIAWTTASSAGTVRSNLESISRAITKYMSANFLVLNNDKTQVLVVGEPKEDSSLPLLVGDVLVNPSNGVDVLGVTFNGQLSPAPHMVASLRSARSLAAASRRLSLHLRERVLRQVVRALVVGRVGYACAVLKPRLLSTDPVNRDMAAIQVAINDCSRAIIGSNRCERQPVQELLDRTGLPSLNRLVVQNIAVEAWKGINYVNDSSDGSKIPIGEILCPPKQGNRNRITRATSSNCIPPPTKYKTDTFAWYAYTIWNLSPTLRSAPTLSAARKAAKELAMTAPI